MEENRLRGILEIAIAILLGLVSVATAAGAYQASLWAQRAGEFESAGGQLRDKSLSSFIASDLAGFDDGERLFEAIGLQYDILRGSGDPEELRDRIEVVLQGASDGVAESWDAWVASGFADEHLPLQTPEYAAAVYLPTASANVASARAFEIADGYGARSLLITIASVVFALALLLLGVAGANASVKVVGLVIGGAVAFAGGIVLSLLAVVG